MAAPRQNACPGHTLADDQQRGRSSHACSEAAIEALPTRPDNVLQLFPTGFDATVGNRGRIDIYVHFRGRAEHSSQAPTNGRVIDSAAEFVTRLGRLDEQVRRRTHERLGSERAVAYQMIFDPVAPHTLPSDAKVTWTAGCCPAPTSRPPWTRSAGSPPA